MVATAHITAATQINTYICQVVPISTLSSAWFLGLTQVFPPPKRRLDLFGHFCRVCRDTYSHSMPLCLSLAKGCVCLCMRAVLNMSYFLFMFTCVSEILYLLWLHWQETVDDDFDVTSAMANRMSLFYAHATPMLNVLSDTTSRFVSEVSVSVPLL